MTCFVYQIMNYDCSDTLSRIQTRPQIRMVVSGSGYVRILPMQPRALRYERRARVVALVAAVRLLQQPKASSRHHLFALLCLAIL